MLDGQKGQMSAEDGNGDPLPEVLNRNGPDIELSGNESVTLNLVGSQDVTVVELNVSEEVKFVLLEYKSGNETVVSYIFSFVLCTWSLT